MNRIGMKQCFLWFVCLTLIFLSLILKFEIKYNDGIQAKGHKTVVSYYFIKHYKHCACAYFIRRGNILSLNEMVCLITSTSTAQGHTGTKMFLTYYFDLVWRWPLINDSKVLYVPLGIQWHRTTIIVINQVTMNLPDLGTQCASCVCYPLDHWRMGIFWYFIP